MHTWLQTRALDTRMKDVSRKDNVDTRMSSATASIPASEKRGCPYRSGDEVSTQVNAVEAEALEGLVSLQPNGVCARAERVADRLVVQGAHLVSAQRSNLVSFRTGLFCNPNRVKFWTHD